ncbi:hypothetical protein M413DRAFT_410626 [Hebeloma cylindrosporum]|uniref:Uncharacterized protein n=1 Tax=Hebeloma cylindrosporum TaxID=76867 RepID=A0A0C2XWI6_HEBCY|nr:hypothetical protein M413DRAFT_410626 [Hebeloma cylindrosporum h7]
MQVMSTTWFWDDTPRNSHTASVIMPKKELYSVRLSIQSMICVDHGTPWNVMGRRNLENGVDKLYVGISNVPKAFGLFSTTFSSGVLTYLGALGLGLYAYYFGTKDMLKRMLLFELASILPVRGLMTRTQGLGEFNLLNASRLAPTRTVQYDTSASAVPTVFERCYSDVLTKESYHISLLAFHTHVGSGSTPKPPATTCGDPGGSPHINLHSTNQETCFCVYDSAAKKVEFDRCFTCLTPECVKDEVLVLVSDVKGLAVDIWTELVDLPLPNKIAIAVLFIAALALFVPLMLGSVAAAGVVISAEAIAAAVVALEASIAAALGIPVPA